MKPTYEELQEQLDNAQRELRSADITMQNLEAKLSALAAENAGLNMFVAALLSIAWKGGSADGAEIQELALKHGLLRQEIYSADEHETLVDDPGNFENGDPVYFRVETPATDAFLDEVRAQAQSKVIEWLDAEITAIDTMYRGDPCYEHDAYWMKTEVLGVVESARKVFSDKFRKGDAV